MDKLLKAASDSGLNAEQCKTTLGGVLNFLKDKLSAADFAKIQKILPETNSLMQQQQKQQAEAASRSAEDSSGCDAGLEACGNTILNSAIGMLASATTAQSSNDTQDRAGGTTNNATNNNSSNSNEVKTIQDLLASLNKMGIPTAQVLAFVPQVVSFLEKNGGVSAVSSLLGGGGGTSGGTGGGNTGGNTSAAASSNNTNSNSNNNDAAGSFMNQAAGLLGSLTKK